jgi:hypothetical protein
MRQGFHVSPDPRANWNDSSKWKASAGQGLALDNALGFWSTRQHPSASQFSTQIHAKVAWLIGLPAFADMMRPEPFNRQLAKDPFFSKLIFEATDASDVIKIASLYGLDLSIGDVLAIRGDITRVKQLVYDSKIEPCHVSSSGGIPGHAGFGSGGCDYGIGGCD